jgi:lipid A 4'-phosphatase
MNSPSRHLCYILLLFAGLTLFFYLFPQLDIRVSALFYNPVNGFYLAEAVPCRLIYISVEVLAACWSVLAVALFIVTWIRRKPFGTLTLKRLIYLLAVLAIGPGLIVNVLLKDHWGRARPYSIQQFGGASTFSPPYEISHECHHNCSFVSGHAAMAFYFIAFAFIFPIRRKRIAIITGAYSIMVGIVRIVQGGHFLSDVLFACVVVYAVAALLYDVMFERSSAG